MKKKAFDHIIETLRKRAKLAQRQCCFPDCTEVAINSHLLQRNGILKPLSEDTSMLYELKQSPFNEDIFYFKLEGIKNTLTFPGFCNKHDTEIFQPIESEAVNFFDYKTQLLLAYRAVTNERRKKEINIDFYDRILGSNTLRDNITPSYFTKIEKSKEQELLGIQDEIYFENLLLSDIFGNSEFENFSFITYELPRVDLCASGVFTYETTIEINELYNQGKVEEPLSEIYFNLLPIDTKSYLIIGCANERNAKCWWYIESFIQETPQQSLKRISDLLLLQLENWLCSPSFYKENIRDREKDIVALTHTAIRNIDERRELDFNLFDRLNLDDVAKEKMLHNNALAQLPISIAKSRIKP